MSVLIVTMNSMADLMSDEGKAQNTKIIGAILANRKVLVSSNSGLSEWAKVMIEEAIKTVDYNAEGQKLVGKKLFGKLFRFIARSPIGIRVVEDEEARKILSEAGIT